MQSGTTLLECLYLWLKSLFSVVQYPKTLWLAWQCGTQPDFTFHILKLSYSPRSRDRMPAKGPRQWQLSLLCIMSVLQPIKFLFLGMLAFDYRGRRSQRPRNMTDADNSCISSMQRPQSLSKISKDAAAYCPQVVKCSCYLTSGKSSL